jgi:hypothetical protein
VSVLEPIVSARRRLNALLVFERASTFAAVAASLSGIAILSFRVTGSNGPGCLWYFLAVVAATAAGAAAGFLGRTDSAKAARWLDGRLDDADLFSAALVCVDRGMTGRFDASIVEKAGSLEERAEAVRPSLRAPVLRFCAAAGISILCVLAYLLVQPGDLDRSNRLLAGARKGRNPGFPPAAPSSPAESVREARLIAERYFPEDAKSASSLERALREGDIAGLRKLFEKADKDFLKRLDGEKSAKGRARMAKEMEERMATEDSLARREAGRNGGTGNRGPAGGAGQGSSPSETQASGEGSGAAPGRAGGRGPNSGSGEGYGDSSRGGPGEALARRGGKSGIGSGPSTLSPVQGREPEARAGGGKAVIERKKDSGIFELVLPGKGANLPLSSVLADSRRAAEAAVVRKGLPSEYGEAVRSYFTTLSRETAGSMGGEP